MKLNFSRVALLTLLGVTVVAIGWRQPAAGMADQPIRVFLPADDFTLPDACSFPVYFHFPVDKEYQKVYFDKQGNKVMTLVSGVLKVELTNLNTQKTVSANVSGGSKVHYDQDGSAKMNLNGRNLFAYFPDKSLPGLFINSGLVQFNFDDQGNLTSYSMTGEVTDMCKELE